MTFDAFNVTETLKEKGISRMGIQDGTFLVVIYNGIMIKVDYNKEDWLETTQRFESAAAEHIGHLFIQKIVSELTLIWLARYTRQTLKEDGPRSVIEMKRQLEGPVTGYGKLVGFSEQYVVVSRTMAKCSGNVRCVCDASPDEHTRPCGYSVDMKYNPPVPIIVSVFDTGNGKPLVCPRCKGIDYEVTMERRIARLFILDDVDNPNANVRQQVIVYDDMVENLTPGELVQVEGEMFVERKAASNKNSKMDNVLHANSIKYLKKKDVVITDDDIKNFYRWKEVSQKEYARELKLQNQYIEWSKEHRCHECSKYAERIVPMTFVDRIVAAFAPNVVGHKVPKRGLLRSIVGGVSRGPGRLSGMIHTFMVGEKGTAKSKLGEETTNVKPNSAHVSGTHASTRTITAIVDPDTKTLMLGVIPLSSLVAIDEVDKIQREEQARLLDILEEQHFNKDAHGYHYEVPAPTTIIGTGNPTNPKFLDSNKIETHEINILDTLRDRFTQVYIFRDDNNTEEKRNVFASEMNAIRKRRLPNYTYLRKFLVFASTLKPIYSPESEKMLNKFWAQQNPGGLMNNRFYNHIFKIAEAEAKLQLCDVINEDIATQTMQSIQLMLLQYAENVKIVVKPSQITFNKFLEILENTKGGFTVYELCKLACKEDPQISVYLGTKWTLEQNWKLKQLVDSLRKHPKVRELNSNPLVFKWFVERMSQSDAPSLNVIDNRYIASDKEDIATPVSKNTSGTSDRNQDFPPRCYWCDNSHFESKEKYDYHCVTRHPGKPGYPGPSDIRELGLTPQGMFWEIYLEDLIKNGDEL